MVYVLLRKKRHEENTSTVIKEWKASIARFQRKTFFSDFYYMVTNYYGYMCKIGNNLRFCDLDNLKIDKMKNSGFPLSALVEDTILNLHGKRSQVEEGI